MDEKQASYLLIHYSPNTFLRHWTYFTASDPTNGQVNYLSKADAVSRGLAYVQPDGTVVLAVDSKNDLSLGEARDSIRIVSKNSYGNSLVIADFAAMPYGCSVWPAFWTVGDNWPNGGEIDIVEGINNNQQNRYTLHTGSGTDCVIPSRAPTSSDGRPAFTADVLRTDCRSSQKNDAGCSLSDPDSNSYGQGFISAGGGVFALLRDDSTGIKIWHFARNSIPPDAHSDQPDPSSWPPPSAFLSTADCDIASHFSSQYLVLDTTLCGGWAGGAYRSSGCPGSCTNYVRKGENFVNAKWVINNITVYY
ncbi:glycoside hydrolase family 16 protein [Russula dissimulans]|nr:glycoside hydrolase family 16 protein [Russula dissimulans]